MVEFWVLSLNDFGKFRLYDNSLNWNPSANWMFAFEFFDIRHNKQTLSNFVYISKNKNVCWSMCGGYIRKFWTVFTVHNSRAQIFGRVIQRHLNQMRPNECVWMFSVFFFVCLFVLEIVRIFSLSGSVSVGIHMFLNRFFQKIFYKWVSLCSLCICCFFVVFFLFLLMNMFLKTRNAI